MCDAFLRLTSRGPIEAACKSNIFSNPTSSPLTPTSSLLVPLAFGESELATALGHAACLHGDSVLFAAAIDVVNRLSAGESNRQLAGRSSAIRPTNFANR
jgi:hypothetical protein